MDNNVDYNNVNIDNNDNDIPLESYIAAINNKNINEIVLLCRNNNNNTRRKKDIALEIYHKQGRLTSEQLQFIVEQCSNDNLTISTSLIKELMKNN